MAWVKSRDPAIPSQAEQLVPKSSSPTSSWMFMPPPKASSTELFQLQNANDFNNLVEFGMGKGLGMLECVKCVECVLRGRTHLLARFTFKLLHPLGEIPLSMYNLKPRFDAFGFNSFIVSIQVLSQMWTLRLPGVPSQRDQFSVKKHCHTFSWMIDVHRRNRKWQTTLFTWENLFLCSSLNNSSSNCFTTIPSPIPWVNILNFLDGPKYISFAVSGP